jgi:FkbM family methyltransferase
VGKEWYDRDWPSIEEINLLSANRLKVGARVFDLGAHQGVYAMIMSRTVGNSGRVVALDPNPTNIELATENCRLNEIDNIELVQAACGSQCGSIRFGHQLNSLVAQDGNGFSVDVLTVDHLAAKYGPPDVVFIDVEGFEGEVLTGARLTRERSESDWFVEVHMNGSLQSFGWTCDQILAFFPSERYCNYVASESERVFVSMENGMHLLTDRFFLVAIDRGRADAK